jgi:hypothetical protein
MNDDIDPAEIHAVKQEIAEVLRRRFDGDPRPGDITFATALSAVSEVLADQIFSAARDEAHAERMLNISGMFVRNRWEFLAADRGKEES